MGFIENVNILAGLKTAIVSFNENIETLNTIVNNLEDINRYSETYKVGPVAPENPSIGHLWFDTTSSKLMQYSSDGIWVQMGNIFEGVVQSRQFIAEAEQTVFNMDGGYTPGYVDVYRQGLLLGKDEYTANDGTSVVLNVPAEEDDIIYIQAFGIFDVANVYNKLEINNIKDDIEVSIVALS